MWSLVVSLLGWLVVWTFWLFSTRNSHPTFLLSFIVTSSLVCAYAAAAYGNHLLLIPRLWTRGLHWQYVACLVTMMAIFTAFSLAIIRFSYTMICGPDTDPYGVYKHYAIDLFGMVVHVAGAALIVWFASRLRNAD